jgi:hypothetical protein
MVTTLLDDAGIAPLPYATYKTNMPSASLLRGMFVPAALRQTGGDAHSAQDAAQSATDLARRPNRLRRA